MTRTNLMLTLALVGLAVSIGCAKPPQTEVDAAQGSLAKSREAEAAEYAAEDLQAAQDTMARLDAEMKTQEEKFAMFRNYDEATRLANEAKQQADRAATNAAANKQRVRQEVSTLIAQARQALVEARALLETAPKGKGTQADLALMKSDLDGVESVLTEVDSSFANENYRDAKAKAEAALASAQGVKDSIEQAVAARSGARP
jgi:hypothetical protein